MYIILVYDVSVERVNKVKSYLRQHLNWVQNSVFEGEITDSKLRELKNGLKSIIKNDKDNIIIYVSKSDKFLIRENIGAPKSDLSNIL
ncbi:MAG TPA: CRISPR-associated endonuclease Cas2 [Methanofastidiosum sp.]|nr:CRISPR-associated endonuclease Cas2 [Methanofastidiosum sp.]HQF89371.1 CRISPR-associated endonuclease Cas2 [Methanofastidiosum sp.]HQG60876.1 CRISPR-associated endonuclease Cas2 [Methanofastidiosum sp.]HQK85412.1 CRISPR-associated endonuclease Cas2 [Methanofastidiosum sp.]